MAVLLAPIVVFAASAVSTADFLMWLFEALGGL
jgi:hypothetical protein